MPELRVHYHEFEVLKAGRGTAEVKGISPSECQNGAVAAAGTRAIEDNCSTVDHWIIAELPETTESMHSARFAFIQVTAGDLKCPPLT